MQIAVPQPKQMQFNIQGNLSGQLVVGNNNLVQQQIGAIIYQLPDAGVFRPRLRSQPVIKLPHPFPSLVGRSQEIDLISRTLVNGHSCQIYAGDGWGKTSLLRVVAHKLSPYRDGIVYLRTVDKHIDDVQQRLFDQLYYTDVPTKYRPGEMAPYLHKLQVAILLDDLALSRNQVGELLDSMPHSSFLLATGKRTLWQRESAWPLAGLGSADSVQLFEQMLGHSLSPSEKPAVRALSRLLHGHPWYLEQAAGAIGERHHLLTSWIQGQRAETTIERLTTETIQSLSREEKRIVAILAALNGAPLNTSHLQTWIPKNQMPGYLNRLGQQQIVQLLPHFCLLPPSLVRFVQARWDLNGWRKALLTHFIAWCTRHQHRPELIVRDVEALMEVLQWAADEQHDARALPLVHAVEGPLALKGLWGAWDDVLQKGTAVAKQTGNKAELAWTLHQRGTRALCLEMSEAQPLLKQALRLRKSIGDSPGVTATQHNLNLLRMPPGQPPKEPPNTITLSPPPKGGGFPWLSMLVILGTVGIVTSIVLVFYWFSDLNGPIPIVPSSTIPAQIVMSTNISTATPTIPPTLTPTPTYTSTPTPTPTFTPTSTHTPTFTPTPTHTHTPIPTNTPTSTYTPNPTITPTPTNTTIPQPDLIVSSLTVAGAPIINFENRVELPIRVIVRNQGSMAANIFKVSVSYTELDGTFVVAFTVPGQSSSWYPRTDDLLLSGGEFVFEGFLAFHPAVHNQTVTLQAFADSCSGEEFTPDFCRIEESNENNNASAPVSAVLPQSVTPTPTLIVIPMSSTTK